MASVRLMAPTGHLGFTPIERESFEAGLEDRPDAIVADSGSADIGPYPLGADVVHSPAEWQRHDLELCLVGARRIGVPLVIGSAADTGTDRGVDTYVAMLNDIARDHGLGRIEVAVVRSELKPADLAAMVDDGAALTGLNGRPAADADTLARTDRTVAVMGIEPIAAALAGGADVVICGRSSDSAIFAAAAEALGGIDRAVSMLAGKLLECASFCAEPFMGKETVIGVADDDGVTVSPKHPGQRCTPLSLASHAMYERLDPFTEAIPGGALDMRGLRFEPVDERTTLVSGARWEPSATYGVKIEGAGWRGERALAIIGIRDPYTLSFLDDVLAWSRQKVAQRFGPANQDRNDPDHYELLFTTYGRNGVMGYLEPDPVTGHEVGIIVEVVAGTSERAAEICALASRNLFYARLPAVKGTAGGASFFSDEVLAARPAYEWTLNHVLVLGEHTTPVEVCDRLFRTERVTIGTS